MYTRESDELKTTRLFIGEKMEYTVENERWITIKPHGDDSDDYRRIKLEDGETPKEAIDRIYKKKDKEKPEEKAKEEPKVQELSKREIYQNAAKALRDAEKATRSAQTMAEIIELAKVEKDAKTALTKARTEFAESLMDEFEETDSSSYDDKLQARKDRYTELSEKAAKESAAAAQKSRDMISAIPMGQPILVGHYSEKRDRAYRERAWDKLGQSVKLADKANYYEGKADSVGKAGISSDDPNAIAKLGQKYKSLKRQQAMMKEANKIIRSKADDAEKIKKLHKIGVSDEVAHQLVTPDFMGRTGYADYKLTGNTAEMRRIIDRVLEIDKNKERAATAPQSEDYSKYGFKVERNTDINRLQLKFDGKPDEKIRTLLKHSGFRWSPRESAWQRQLTSNAEYSLKNIVKKLEVDNSKEQDMALLDELKKLIMNVENDKGDDYMVENAKEDKRKLIDEVGGILKDKVDEEVWRTIIGKLEKIAYEKSEAGTADNACKKDVKNEDEEEAEDKKEVKDIKEDVKEDVEEEDVEEEEEKDNEVNNSKVDFFKKVMDVYNAANKAVETKAYESREDKLNAADEYFSS